MKVKRIGITEILRRIWLFFAPKRKSSDSFGTQQTQLIVKLIIADHNCHRGEGRAASSMPGICCQSAGLAPGLSKQKS